MCLNAVTAGDAKAGAVVRQNGAPGSGRSVVTPEALQLPLPISALTHTIPAQTALE